MFPSKLFAGLRGGLARLRLWPGPRSGFGLPAHWWYLLLFGFFAVALAGWTFFQMREDSRSAHESWRVELERLASDRAVLLTNWLADRRDDIVDVSNRTLVQQLFHPKSSPPVSTSIRVRMDQFALTYGYGGMVVMDPRGRIRARTTRLPILPAQLASLMQNARALCGPVLEALPGEAGTSVLTALAPVRDPTATSCAPEAVLGYVAIEAVADQALFSRLHMDLPPPGVETTLLRNTPSGPVQLMEFARAGVASRPAAVAVASDLLGQAAFGQPAGFHELHHDGQVLWFASQYIPLVGWVTVASVDRDFALNDSHRTRRFLLLFDLLLLTVAAGLLATLHQRARTRELRDELRRQSEMTRLREYARRIVESSPVGLVVLDGAGTVISANRAFCEMAGAESDEIVTTPVGEWIDMGSAGAIDQWLVQPIRDGLARLRLKRGLVKPVHLTLTPLDSDSDQSRATPRALLTVEDLTQRRQMEERYRLLFERNVTPIIQSTLEGQIVDCNDAFARMLGFESRSELKSASILPFYRRSADRGRIVEELRQTGSMQVREVEMRRRDNEVVWVLAGASMMEAGEEVPTMLLTTLVDITQRKQVQRKVEEQARLLDLTRDAVLVRGLDGTIRFWNRGAQLMYGWSPEQALGQTTHQLLRTVFPVDFSRVLQELLQTGFWSGDLRQVRHDGTPMHVASRWVLQRDSNGEPRTVLETNTDLTERRAAELALAESNRKIIEIFDSITEGFFALDNNWNFTYLNREAERMLKVAASDLLGKNIWEAMPACWGGPFQENYARALREGIKVEFEEFSPTLGAWVEVRAYPSPSGLSIYFRDVSERRHLEARVRQAEKMDAVGRLAGGIAHDFNNLLNVIGGYSELLTQNLEQQPRLLRYAQEITASTLRAGALTRQLLTFGRRQKPATSVVNLNSIVQELDPLLRRLMGEDIELVLTQEPGLGKVQADPSQMEQVIVNLAANARDAMPKGGKFLIETANFDLDETFQDEQVRLDPGRYILLSCSDSGVGMDAAVRRRIFEPFFTTKEVGKGTGLGLATVDGIVQQSGGAIWVYSEPGRGTTFKIYLPRAESEEVAAASITVDTTPVRGGDESILLVEDEPALCSLIREMLDKFGYKVVTARNGAEALQRVEDSGPFQLLLTDVVMPGMGGADLADRVLQELPDIRILFMSGYAGRSMLRQGRLQPGAHFLAKPFSSGRLARAIRETLDHQDVPTVVEWLSQES